MIPHPKRAAKSQHHGRIFNLDLPEQPNQRQGLFRKLYAKSVPSLERLFGLDRLNAVYAKSASSCAANPQAFIRATLEVLKIHCPLSMDDLSRIPKTGPLVVVANHPFGAIDGIILWYVLSQVRPDVKIMGNYMLSRVPELRDMFIFVDPFGGEAAVSANLKPMREALRLLKQGGVLAAFPAGEVAHLKLKDRGITEPAWNPSIAGIIRRTGAAVLPVFFNGHNGKLFQLMGLIHAKLRTAMLPRAVLERQGDRIDMRIGNVIPARKIEALGSDEEVLGYLRNRTLLLQHRQFAAQPGATPAPKLARRRLRFRRATVATAQQQIVTPIDPAVLATEVAQLDTAEHLLVDSGDMCVYAATAEKIPGVLRELGRLREITFRATGEGTGKSIDLDRFDYDYFHLFIWNRKTSEIVGAYRLGPSDSILRNKGTDGLYTSTLFNFDVRLLDQLGPALEMGRSFIRESYQRSFAPLLMLWKGIGAFCVRQPKYKIVFGPVSISAMYHSVSKQLMVQFLKVHHMLPTLAGLVSPRNPFRERAVNGWDDASVKTMVKESDDLSELVSDVEPDQKGIPILLKQYLKLGAKVLAVNVDPDFSDVVDGLIVVDLTQTAPKILDKYMGKDGRAAFMEYHAARVSRVPV